MRKTYLRGLIDGYDQGNREAKEFGMKYKRCWLELRRRVLKNIESAEVVGTANFLDTNRLILKQMNDIEENNG